MKEVTVDGILRVVNSLDNIEVSTEQLDEYLPDLGMDSISFIQIVVGLEETFDCEIPEPSPFDVVVETHPKDLCVLVESTLNDKNKAV